LPDTAPVPAPIPDAPAAPRAVVLSIGEEVLRGEVVNTNAAWLSAELCSLGFRVVGHRTVADRGDEIVAALRETTASGGLAVATGGLGPTGDDITADAAARFLGTGLVESPQALESIARRMNRPVSELSAGGRRMALVPDGAEVLPNPAGAAPGIHLSCQLPVASCQSTTSSCHLFLLPGVPHEMKAIFAESVRPLIEKLFPDRVRRSERHWHVAGWPESDADAAAREALGDLVGPGRLELGTLLGRGWVALRAAGEGAAAAGALEEADRRIASRFGDALWGTGKDDTLEAAAARELLARRLTLALAESCTGGLVASRLVSLPGISAALVESLVTYSNEAKTRLLGVPPELIARHGAVSRECAEAMAGGLRERSGADITLAVTGVAGPEGGSPEKPVGTVHFALSGPAGPAWEQKRFGGSRDWVRERAAAHGLWLLWKAARATGG
jgi:nicotinamide-nucleotide amidase